MSDIETIPVVKRQTKLFVPTKPFAPVEAQVQRAQFRVHCGQRLPGSDRRRAGVGKRTNRFPNPLPVPPGPAARVHRA